MLSSESNSFKPGSDEFNVERLIASAKDYVIPTDQLRPKVLEASQQRYYKKIGGEWVGRTILVTAILFWIFALSTPFMHSLQAKFVDERDFVETRSQEIFQSGEMEIHNATSQAYNEWRNSLNNKLHASGLDSTPSSN